MSFWKDKRVLITGGQGFVGRAVIAELFKRKCGAAMAPDKERYNLTKEDYVRRLFERCRPDIVIHLAGKVGGIGVNKAFPGSFYYNNMMIGTLVMEYARRSKVEKLVGLAAGCGYPEGLDPPYKESDFFNGFPDENSFGYSMAKKSLVVQSLAYRKQYGFDSTIMLPANLYGPNDNFDLDTSHVVPALIRKFVDAKKNNSEQVVIWGSGEASREFLYVKDAAFAIVEMAEKGTETGPFNLGTGKEHTVVELIEVISKATGYTGRVIWDTTKPDGQKRRVYDMSKLKEHIGFVPGTTLEQGISETVNWFKDNYIPEPNKAWKEYAK